MKDLRDQVLSSLIELIGFQVIFGGLGAKWQAELCKTAKCREGRGSLICRLGSEDATGRIKRASLLRKAASDKDSNQVAN